MSGLQWAFIAGLAAAGYLLVSFVIDAVRKDRPSKPAVSDDPLDPPPPQQVARSAWEEFEAGRRDRQ